MASGSARTVAALASRSIISESRPIGTTSARATGQAARNGLRASSAAKVAAAAAIVDAPGRAVTTGPGSPTLPTATRSGVAEG